MIATALPVTPILSRDGLETWNAIEITGGLNAFGHPMANIRTREGGPLLSCYWNDGRKMWQVDPD